MEQSTEFAKRLERLIEYTGLSKAEFSRKTGVAQASLTYYVRGIYKPKDENIIKIATACNINPDWLRGRSEDMFGQKNTVTEVDDSIPQERRELIEKVRSMSDEQFKKLESILSLIG